MSAASMKESKSDAKERLKDLDPYWSQPEVVPIFVQELSDAMKAWVLWRYTLETRYVYAIAQLDMGTGHTLGDPAYFSAIDEAWNYWVRRCATS